MKTLEDWKQCDTIFLGAANGAKSKDRAKQAGIRYHRKLYATLKLQCAINWPELELLVEPWFRGQTTRSCRSPDAVLLDRQRQRALVIEVKKNWRNGRDQKLLEEYVPIVANAFAYRAYPAMIVSNVAGLRHEPLLGLASVLEGFNWRAGQPTPTVLVL